MMQPLTTRMGSRVWGTAALMLTILMFGIAATATPSPAAAAPATVATSQVSAAAAPGTVLISSDFKVTARLTYQDSAKISGVATLTRHYTFGPWTGTGFVVTPTGAIVTASHVVDPDRATLRHLAVNAMFREMGYRFPHPEDAYTITDNRYLNTLLQQCYHGTACHFTITPEITAYPAVGISNQIVFPTAMPAQILKHTGFNATDVAVLKVNGQNMPTVPLAKSALDLQQGAQLDVLGFPGSVLGASSNGVTTPTLAPVTVSSIRPGAGASQQIQVQGDIEHGESGGPVLNSSGEVVGLVSYGFDGTGDNFLRSVDDIHTALAAAGITAASGPVDTAYAKAMNLDWNHHYTAAVPALRSVLDLDAGNPLAQQYLAKAAALAGSRSDIRVRDATTTSSRGHQATAAVMIGAGVVILLAAAGLVLFLRRRDRGTSTQLVARETQTSGD